MVLRKLFWILLAGILTIGFRTLPFAGTWDINNSTAAARKLFVSFSSSATTIKNDLPTGHALAGGSNPTVGQLMQAIFDDYNNINSAFVTLVDTSDSDYAANGTNRTITINFDGSAGATGGQALPTYKDGIMVDCKIDGSQDLLDSAKAFTQTITHELGHCLGLDHPQELTKSIMSYFVDGDTVTLQTDDKMGIVHLYPTDPAAAKEAATYGLSCERN